MATTTTGSKSPYDLSLDCVHCGLCLSSCPTYTLDHNEADSPRGRIYLMRALYEGRIGVGDPLVEHLDLCLGCRACETACPADVEYGELLARTRSRIQSGRKSTLGSLLGKILLREVFPYPRRLRTLASLGHFYQASGLESVVNALGLPALLGRSMPRLARSMPRIPGKKERRLPAPFHPSHIGVRARVALLTGCVMNELFSPVHRATIKVLQKNGCEVYVPPTQGCCGALHLHLGDLDTARDMAGRNFAAFLQHDVDAIVVNSAGCGSAMKELHTLFEGTDDAATANTFSAKVKDISEFLAELGPIAPERAVLRKVAYDDPCHLIHGQGVSTAPRDLLRLVKGLELVPLPDADRCCGAAGTYFIQEAETSLRILEPKIAHIKESGADTVATGNPGCALHIASGLARAGLRIDVKHPMEILAEAYE